MRRTEMISGSIGARGVHVLRFALLVAALTISACALPAIAAANEADSPDFSQYLTIKFVEGTSSTQRLAVRRSIDATFETSLTSPLLQQASLPESASADAAADTLESNPAVDFAVASGRWKADELETPYFDDRFYEKQWALNNYGQVFMSRLVDGNFEDVSGTPGADINAPEAWSQIVPGNLTPEKIGVIDTGVAYEHPDLAANMVPGSDFYDADNDPRDVHGHGTHVASVAAGVGDNAIGTSGVNPWAKVMPLRAADEYGSFSWAAIEQAVAHGLANGVRLFNGSFGGADDDPAFKALIAGNPQALFVFSSGNGGGDQVGDDHDAASGLGHRFPCDIDLPNVICVGASNWLDAMSPFSDYGVKSVDLLAPGSSIYSAKPCMVPAPDIDHQTECPFDAVDPTAPIGLGGGPFAFQLLSGTSMAAPAVTGAASLLWSRCPALKSSQIKSAIVESVTPLPAVQTRVAYGGRLNLAGAVSSIGTCPAPSDGTDWPTPPAQPSGPDGDGGATGGTGPTAPPTVDYGTSPGGTAKTEPLTFQITRPRSAKVGRSSTVSFKLTCSDDCSAAAVVRPLAAGVTFKAFKSSLARGRSGTRTMSVKVPRATLRAVRALLAGRTKVQLKFSVTVTDRAGLSSRPIAFTVKLAK
ncbi:MAG: S8 family serine peptidase [Thermoleophilaceae bacterium]|nr:S8 family serine peptidase [Thermoleophilaceae bacterium]